MASVAVSANCHCGSPNRRVSSSPTQSASSVGSMNVSPARPAPPPRGRRLGRVPGHRARVPQAEIDVLDAVDVPEPRARGLAGKDREAAGPAHHPVHRHSGEERRARTPRERRRARMLPLEPLQLALEQPLRSLVELRGPGGRRAHSLRIVSPRRTVPGWTTRAYMPRRRSARPLGWFTKRMAAEPKRAVNFAHPVWS